MITPLRIAELLVLRDDFPRSLHFCLSDVFHIIEGLAEPRAEVLRLAGELYSRLRFCRIQDVLEQGLHEYLTDFLRRITALAAELAITFFNPPVGTHSP